MCIFSNSKYFAYLFNFVCPIMTCRIFKVVYNLNYKQTIVSLKDQKLCAIFSKKEHFSSHSFYFYSLFFAQGHHLLAQLALGTKKSFLLVLFEHLIVLQYFYKVRCFYFFNWGILYSLCKDKSIFFTYEQQTC